MPAAELTRTLRESLEDSGCTSPPSLPQRLAVTAWARAVVARGDDLYVLDAPDDPRSRFDWDWIWLHYREFATLCPDRTELTIGVVGFD